MTHEICILLYYYQYVIKISDWWHIGMCSCTLLACIIDTGIENKLSLITSSS